MRPTHEARGLLARLLDRPARSSTRRRCARTGAPVLLDGAQGLGAVPVDVARARLRLLRRLRPEVALRPRRHRLPLRARGARAPRCAAPWPGYHALERPAQALELTLHEDARRFDHGLPRPARRAWALASLDVLEEAGWDEVHDARATRRASAGRRRCASAAARWRRAGDSTLVSWRSATPRATSQRLARAGVVVRDLPGHGLVRASVGAWTATRTWSGWLALAACGRLACRRHRPRCRTRSPPTHDRHARRTPSTA